MTHCLHGWFSVVRHHFVQAFNFSRPLYSRITHFALGVIKAIPIVGHLVMGVDWLISHCFERGVSHPGLPSDIAPILKVEKIAGRDHISRIENQLKSLRKTIEVEDLDKVHGQYQENPYADMASSEVLKLDKGVHVSELGKAFSRVRNRITRSYSYAPTPQLDSIAIVGIDLVSPEEQENLVRLANEVIQLYPKSKTTLYLLIDFNKEWVGDISSDKEKQLRSLGLHSEVQCLSVLEPQGAEGEDTKHFDLMVGCYGKDSYLREGKILQQALGTSLGTVPWVNVMHTLPSRYRSRLSLPINTEKDKTELYKEISRTHHQLHTLGMGLGAQDSGLLLDRQRLHAPLSQGSHCHSYLADLTHEELKILLFSAFVDAKNISKKELREVSLNFANDTSVESWLRFLLLVSYDEKEKDVVVVCNHSEPNILGLPPEAVSQLIEELSDEGYSYLNVVRCDLSGETTVQQRLLLNADEGRSMTVVISELPEGHPDIRNLQLASERIFVSREKEAADAYASGCKVVAFDDEHLPWVSSHIAYAEEIREKQEQTMQGSLTEEQLGALLCNTVSTEKNLAFALDAVIKQSVWRFRNPDLFAYEREALEASVTDALVSYVSNLDMIPYTSSQGIVIEDSSIVRTSQEHTLIVNCAAFDKLASQIEFLCPSDVLPISGKDPLISDDEDEELNPKVSSAADSKDKT
ncbi:DUF562 domain-containing protein [Chlamydia pneumoniae]|uniref:DUF562 domain-containing protein n=1 Tax=Chlamydia pneumoniae TaxID=83558 RepID=UPI00000CCD13|nr:DUF562 domain-containing protein [Chlamydia pneumoniae]BAA98662.1 hypothetical protein [Chlamydia pneumoniae J138]